MRLLLQPNFQTLTSLGNLRPLWCDWVVALLLSRENEEAEYSSVICDSCNPLPLPLSSSSSALTQRWRRRRSSGLQESQITFVTAGVPPPLRGDLRFLCTGGRLKGICDLIITASPHLGDPAASIFLSAPLALPLSHSVTSSLSLSLTPCLSIHLWFSLCLYAVPQLSAVAAVCEHEEREASKPLLTTAAKWTQINRVINVWQLKSEWTIFTFIFSFNAIMFYCFVPAYKSFKNNNLNITSFNLFKQINDFMSWLLQSCLSDTVHFNLVLRHNINKLFEVK